MEPPFKMNFLVQQKADEIEVDVNSRTFEFIEQASIVHMGDFLANLNFNQAIDLIGGVYVAIAKAEDAQATTKNGFVIDAALDGTGAVVGFAERERSIEMRPNVDDERVLILNVLQNKRIWHTIIGRDRKVEQSLRFGNTVEQN